MHSLDNGKYQVESDTLYHNSTIPGVKVKRGIIPTKSGSPVGIKIINLQKETESV